MISYFSLLKFKIKNFSWFSCSSTAWVLSTKFLKSIFGLKHGILRGGSITVLLTSCFTGLESVVWLLTIFAFICRLIQTSQTGGQWYSDTSPFSIPWLEWHKRKFIVLPTLNWLTLFWVVFDNTNHGQT